MERGMEKEDEQHLLRDQQAAARGNCSVSIVALNSFANLLCAWQTAAAGILVYRENHVHIHNSAWLVALCLLISVFTTSQ